MILTGAFPRGKASVPAQPAKGRESPTAALAPLTGAFSLPAALRFEELGEMLQHDPHFDGFSIAGNRANFGCSIASVPRSSVGQRQFNGHQISLGYCFVGPRGGENRETPRPGPDHNRAGGGHRIMAGSNV
jgi:hypothetical protein